MRREELESTWNALNRIEIKPGVQNAMNLVKVANFLIEAEQELTRECTECKEKEAEDGSINR